MLKLERIQRIATKMVPELKNVTHEERLKKMQVNTFEEKERLENNIQIDEQPGRNRYKRSNIEKKRRG